MKRALLCLFAAAALPLVFSQTPRPDVGSNEIHPPATRAQQEAIVKSDYEKSVKDAAQLIDLAEQLKMDLEKNERHVISMNAIRKTEEIEKIARRIRSRMKRF